LVPLGALNQQRFRPTPSLSIGSNLAKYLILFSLSAAACVVLTPVIRRLAFLIGAIDFPGGRRSHPTPTPRLGGIAILIAIAAGLALMYCFDSPTFLALTSGRFLIATIAVAMVAIAGSIDDVWGLSASSKLLVEVLAGFLAFIDGYRIDTLFNLPLGWLSLPATLIWIVMVTNAFNLVDGMDGLAAGVAAIISATLCVLSLSLISVQGALILAALTGALVGFLPFNLQPARVFLGDSGSLSIGIIFALISIETSNKLATGIAILVPGLAMGLPLAEITITVLRRLLRRIHVVRQDTGKERYEFLVIGKTALFVADREHIHHRLLSLGLSKGKAVVTLYLATFLTCTAGFAVAMTRGLNQALLLAASGIAAVAAVRYLGYEELRPLSRGTLMPIFDVPNLNLKPFHALVDFACVNLSCLAAFAIVSHAIGSSFQTGGFIELPLVCLVQLLALLLSGLYRRSYRYAAIADVIPVIRSVGLAGLAGFIVVSLLTGTLGITVAILDTYFLGTLILASRMSFRLLDHARAGSLRNGRAVLIYGAGRGGMVALTELHSNPELSRFAIGFLDDDRLKHGSKVRGLPVYGPSALSKLIEEVHFAELLVASGKIPEERVRDITFRCLSAGIPVRRLTLEWVDVPVAIHSTNAIVEGGFLVGGLIDQSPT
jgi:UDP-GlcNAc:undecaprenyl-phosphate GlcNAc-1-phosphate transferase